MDLKKRLDLGQSKTQTNEIVDYVNGIPNRFKELVEVYLKGPLPDDSARGMALKYLCRKVAVFN